MLNYDTGYYTPTVSVQNSNVHPYNKATNSNVICDTEQKGQGIKTSTALKWGIGILAATAGIYLAVRKGRLLKIKPLASHIDFKPAKTIEEARAFAVENFGIKKFQVNDLKMANYVNEGLANATNISKGKIVLPRQVIETVTGRESQSMNWCTRTLTLNPKCYLSTTSKNNDKFHVLYHELGHLNHYSQNPNLVKAQQVRRLDKPDKLLEKDLDIMQKHMDLLKNKGIFDEVSANSAYAICAPNEYVAEMYGYMMSGIQLPKPVMDVYYKYGGPVIGKI